MPRLSANKLHMLFSRWKIAGDNICCNSTPEVHEVDFHTPIATSKNDTSIDLSSIEEDEVSEQSQQDIDEDEVIVDEDKESVVVTPV